MNCEDPTRRFSKYQSFGYTQRALGMNILYGIIQNAEFGDGHIFYEVFGGFGIRYRSYRISNLQDGACLPSDLSSGFSGARKGWVPSVQLGVRVGFSFPGKSWLWRGLNGHGLCLR